MKTIEELALEHNLLAPTKDKVLDAIPTLKEARQKRIENIEALCKAYMQDRLESLEPVVWLWGSAKANAWQIAYEEPVAHDDSIEIRPLHYISTLKDKP